MARKLRTQNFPWDLYDIDRVMNGDPNDDEALAEELGRSVMAIKTKRAKIRKEMEGWSIKKPEWERKTKKNVGGAE